MELFAEQALLPDGWRRNVRISVSPDGCFESIVPDARISADAERKAIVVPSQLSLHSHAFQRGMAGLAESRQNPADTFWTWRRLMYQLAHRISPEQMQDIASYLYMEMLTAGYTQVAEFHYLHHAPGGATYGQVAEMSLRVGEAARAVGIGLTLLPTLYERGGFDGRPLQEAQERFATTPELIGRIISETRSAWAGKPLLSVGLGLHSLRAVDLETASDLLSVQTGPVHIHVAEQQKEVEECVAFVGARPVEYLLSQTDVDERWCLVHATHLSASEVAGMARSGAVAGLCPITEANLGDGLFPLAPYVNDGGRFGIGSDSNVLISPWEELRTLEYGQRLFTQTRCAALPAEALGSTGGWLYRQALDGGRRACGLESWGLVARARADLCVLDEDQLPLPYLQDDAVLDAAIFGSRQPPVKDVLCGGQWRVRDGRHLNHDAVTAAFRRTVRTLLDL
ncbi:MAG: formimidoylglutamate deiminase [Gluconobacter potus]|uniref:Formimidoylglutamate deiminase n=1 Tax=Gluconobacter potus TaxID=2724927 RepID=A0ABR9YNT2_9PROT|nr:MULTISPECIES: formimidoylglutamate deiminase [Gluconobacter]MBF0865093.1 formimidoylglutamate deiminase [Gluconobacter sp. R71656]MBF0868248.1 formimidoylglutamate deiminase [Gluconobacter sp. R75628]MBF0874230.1 formimidoylglutamate deiminase [Gluconobacter sp. R75629]MBF0883207.1 formimidoylglutamate deiminase [Gluconobacter potus]